MTNNQTADLNVVLFPSESTRQTLLRLSETIKDEFSFEYTVNDIGHEPHMSLYAALYPEKNISQITTSLEHIAHDLKPFQITLSHFSFFSGYLFFNALPNRELQDLHEKIVEALNPFREGLVSEDQKRLTGLTDDQRNMIQKYGYVSAMQLYMPHVTLAHSKEHRDEEAILRVLPSIEITFEVGSIALVGFDLDDTLREPVFQKRL